MKEIKLTVAEAKKRDIGRGVARIDTTFMEQIGVTSGELIEIVGKKRTVATAWPGYDNDKNKGIIRIDSFTCEDAGLLYGEDVLVRRVEAKAAQKIILAPVGMRLNVDQDFEDFVKNRLMGRAVIEMHKTIVMMLSHAIPFDIVRTLPHNDPIQIVNDTVISILNNPFPHPERKLQTPTDIRYLLRFDWLNMVATRIKAKKIVFLIPDHEVCSENEQDVIEEAERIAYEKLLDVRVEVRFETNGTAIGTLQWVEVDMLGRLSATYPDIELPPPAPSLAPEGARRKFVPPMKRCFKTGVDSCPKEINFSPKSVVVAMPFREEFTDPYKYAIKPALEESGFKPWKADEQISNIDIMCKICQAIQESGYVLANITDWNPNVVFELGLAYGLGRNVILIKHKKGEVPVDLKGLEYIEYSTIDELKRNLLLFLQSAATE
jgi:hypothetical protein